MSGYTGYVDNSNGTNAHENFIDLLESKAQAAGWTTLRKSNTGGTGDTRRYELILQGVGLSGTEQIYIGFRAYQDSTNDYYNIEGAVFTGYLSGNTWATQPGFKNNSCCAHNLRIDYFLNVNAQRIVFCLKVGNPVYEHMYAGKFFPNATPSQYPYPVAIIGTLSGAPATRYSVVDSTNHIMGYYGNLEMISMRFVSGYIQPYAIPFSVSQENIRDNNGNYALTAIQLASDLTTSVSDNAVVKGDIYGTLDGVYHCSGFNLTVESTTTLNSKNYVLLQDVNRDNVGAYIALDITP